MEQEENVYVQARLFQEVVDRVSNHYVDEVEERTLYRNAIQGLLEELGDPNTSFIEASEYENFRIRTEGDYGGVGLEIVEQEGYVTVVSPIPGSPGARAGIRAGDRFLEIAGEDAAGWEADQAVERLRGEPGTAVEVKMGRLGVDEPIPFTLTRARIQLRAVPFTARLEGNVGYVPLQIFQSSSVQEVAAAVDSLRESAVEGVILDLRGNPGGLLDQGIGVTDLFLPSGETVVETRGRSPEQNERYRSSRDERFPDLPVVVLVDETSASASEIVAGALQDHDRALVVGNTTFGKGSVQSLYNLTGGNGLKMTTARWYTPAGRSIQKSMDERRDLGSRGTLTLDGRIAVRPDTAGRPVVESMAGRPLLGGGGITPDILILPDTLGSAEQRAVRAVFRQAGAFNVALFDFATRYIQENPGATPEGPVTDAMLEAFEAALVEEGVEADPEVLRGARRFLRYHVGREVALQLGGDRAEFLRTVDEDRQLQRARELILTTGTTVALLGVSGQSGARSTEAPALAELQGPPEVSEAPSGS
jgi:carboxyl-terminal processing protease